MELKWYGHSCFMLKTDTGKRILMDPYNPDTGYNHECIPHCDLITVSHRHPDHSFINKNNTDTKTIDAEGFFKFENCEIEGIKSFHDNMKGLKRGPDIIYTFKFPDLKICHLGDLGEIPDQHILEKLKNTDFLLIPVGGNYTLDGRQAAKLCNIITPRFIIPMHFKTSSTLMKLNDCKKFLLKIKNIEKINSNFINIDDFKNQKKTEMKILFFNPV